MNTNAMFNISYGLYVLTVSDNDTDNGCIINTLMQLTSTPLQISVTVNKSNLTHDMIKSAGSFNLSVLDTSAPFELFRHFGFQSGKNVKKLGTPDSYKYKPYYADNGMIYLKEYTNAFISCKVVNEIDLGTHTQFIAEVTDCDILSDKPSMTYAYYHANVKPKPQKPAADEKKSGWVCKICGYIYEGDELPADFVCPICKHGAVDFEKL